MVSLKSLERITWQALAVLEHSMKKAFANFTLQTLHEFESKLNSRIDQKHTNENQHIQTLMAERINALTKEKAVLEIRLAALKSKLEEFSHDGILRGIRFESRYIDQQ